MNAPGEARRTQAAQAQTDLRRPAEQQAPAPGEEWEDLPGEYETQQAPATQMCGRLRSRTSFWRRIGAPALVLSWLTAGFPLLFKDSLGPPAPYHVPNHTSAAANAAFVTEAVRELVASGSAQRWDKPDPPHCVSALGVVPKKGGKLRLILDLRPLNAHLHIPGFKYEGLEAVQTAVLPQDYLITADLQAGYHHIDMAAADTTYLGFEWDKQLYTFTALPFGLATAPWAFTKVTRVLVRHWRSQGIRTLGYIDDFLFAAASAAALCAARDQVLADFAAAGLVLSINKCCLTPAQTQSYLGVLVDTARNQFRIAADKRDAALALCSHVLQRGRVLARDVSRLAGRLISMRWAFGKISQVMTRHMYSDIAGVPLSHHIQPSAGSADEARFWLASFDRFNGAVQIWRKPALRTVRINTDAAGHGLAGNGGWAGVLQTPSGRPLVARDTFSFATAGESSTRLELTAVLHTLRSFHQQGHLPRGVALLLKGNNQGTCEILHKGSSCAPACHSVAKAIFWFCIQHDISLQPTWVPRDLNQAADYYSKLRDSGDVQLNPALFRRLNHMWGRFTIDLFASPRTTQLRSFYSRFANPTCTGINAFAHTWGTEQLSWAYPPYKLVGRVLQHAQHCHASLCLIVPLWPSAAWWHSLVLQHNGCTHFRPFVRGLVVFEPTRDIFTNAPAPAWRMLALRVVFRGPFPRAGPRVPL